jgi:hypothetical protein
MKQTSAKNPIAAVTLEMVSERLAKSFTMKRGSDERPTTELVAML